MCLNTTVQSSVGTTPFRLLFGTYPSLRENREIRELHEKEWISEFQDGRDELRDQVKGRIEKVQRENRKNYNKDRVVARGYRENDLVAIKRTQQGPGLKFANKFLGSYKIIRRLRSDRYMVEKVGDGEGPMTTSTAADHMKTWACDSYDSLGEDDDSAGEATNT